MVKFNSEISAMVKILCDIELKKYSIIQISDLKIKVVLENKTFKCFDGDLYVCGYSYDEFIEMLRWNLKKGNILKV